MDDEEKNFKTIFPLCTARRNQSRNLHRSTQEDLELNQEILPDGNCSSNGMTDPAYFNETENSFNNTALRSFSLPASVLGVAILVGLGIKCTSDGWTTDKQFECIKTDILQLKYETESIAKNMQGTALAVENILKVMTEMKNLLPKLSESTVKLKDDVVQEINGQTSYLNDAISRAIKPLQEIIKRDFSTDISAKADFALESTGGRVINTRNTETYTQTTTHSFFGIPICEKGNPQAIIQPGVLPGQCWAFKGSHGSAIIQLIGEIYISSVSMQHIPVVLSPTGSITSAPKVFSIWGLKSEDDGEGFFFGQFSYDKNGPPLQTFDVQHKSKTPYPYLELKVLSNHGEQKYTCIYRLRVHGKLANLP